PLTGSARRSLELVSPLIIPKRSRPLELIFNCGRLGEERTRSGCSKSVSRVLMKSNSSWLLHRTISIKSGQRYKITNEQSKLVVDLSGANNKSVLGYNFHGGANQQVTTLATWITCASHNHDTLQWIIERQVNDQYTIRSVGHHKYLGIEKTPGNGTHLVGLDKPQFWDIEIQPDSKDATKLSAKYVTLRTLLAIAADFEFL
ncbi:hypothetical protein EDB85DRAFT_1943540, partial [Lactarius pseudohatsudake]